jgi:hypothetical protein
MVREIDVTKRSIGSVSSSIYPVVGFLIRPRYFFINNWEDRTEDVYWANGPLVTLNVQLQGRQNNLLRVGSYEVRGPYL